MNYDENLKQIIERYYSKKHKFNTATKNDKKVFVESQIIGAIIGNPSLIEIASKILTEKSFTKSHSKIFTFICSLNRDKNLSQNIIIDNLAQTKFEIIDLFPYVYDTDIVNEEKLQARIKYLCDLNLSIIAENKLLANLQKVKTSEDGFDSLVELRNDIDSLLETKDRFRKEKNLAESLSDIFSGIESERNGEGDSLTSLHFPSFNHCTKGLLPGNLITVAGCWKNGKSTFALNLILDIAFKENVPVGIFSLEMSKKEIERKILSMFSNIGYEKLRNPKSLTESELEQLKQIAVKKFSASKIYLNYKILNSENEIRAIAKNWINKFGVKIILIDYIGLIKTSQKGKSLENRERELSFISQFLKHTAIELNIPIISVAQLNRAGLMNPSSENLAESIGIARDSDFIFTIYKPITKNNEMKIKIGSKEIPIKENYFIVKLADSRHTLSGKKFILELNNSGNFRELATEYENDANHNYRKSYKPAKEEVLARDIESLFEKTPF